MFYQAPWPTRSMLGKSLSFDFVEAHGPDVPTTNRQSIEPPNSANDLARAVDKNFGVVTALVAVAE